MNGAAGQELRPVAATTEVWSFQRRVTRRLLAWALGSMALGLLLARGRSPLARAFGVQACAWGAVDAAIALVGQRAAERKQMRATPAVEAAQARSLRRLLWINAGLDVGYVASGAWLAATKGRNNPAWRGHGLGVVAQGAFLLVFDLVHARASRAVIRGLSLGIGDWELLISNFQYPVFDFRFSTSCLRQRLPRATY